MTDGNPGAGSTTIRVTGSGTCPQDVEKLSIDAGLSNFSPQASRAMQENAEVMARLRSELGRFGVDAKDIRTADLRLSPAQRRDNERRVELHGFQVSHRLTIVFRDVERTGEIIDALVEAGANQIQGPTHSRVPTPEGLEIARAEAIRDANRRAESFAKALGLHVKRVVSMSDGYTHVGPAAMLGRSATTQLSLGEDKVIATVQAEYELVPRDGHPAPLP